MNLWNPKTPVMELPFLSDSLKRRLYADEYRTAEKLDNCPLVHLLDLGYNSVTIGHIRKALRQQRQFAVDIADILLAEGITGKMMPSLQLFDLLNLPLTTAQLGYLLRWQRDVGGRYGEKEIYCVAGGRVYYCTECRYRDERSNFCGFCMKKLLDDIAEKKRGNAP